MFQRTLAVCLLSTALLPACATKGNYLINRGSDLADCLRAKVMVGKGVAAKIEYTRLLHLGGGWYNVKAFGLHNREVGNWRETTKTWGLLVGYHDEEVEGIDRYSGDYGWQFDQSGPGGFQQAQEDNPLDLLTFRATLFLFAGFDVELRLGEFVDFAVGLFQFDPAGDDHDYSSGAGGA